MNKNYYYPISSTSLAAIFGQACILPACLYKNRPADIQSKYENFILLTEKFGNLYADCCLELVLTQEEIKSLVDVKGGFYLYEMALPVSRIKKIFFSKKEQASRTISAVNLSTAFIPEQIVSNDDNVFDDTNVNEIVVPEELVDSLSVVRKAYENYDRILGALSLMKVAHQDGCNVSPLYIDTLSKFNSLIESQKNASGNNVDKKYHRFFDEHNELIEQSIDSTILEDVAKKENQTINKNKITKVIDPTNLDGIVYICYILSNYGVGEESRRGKIDELILNNFVGLKPGKEENCAFYYGYNRGYSVFNNEYRGEHKTEVVKFQLNSPLDYYTIESVFEYTFNKNIPSNIPFIDSLWASTAPKKTKRGEYIILNTIIRDRKNNKMFSEDWWANCLSSFLPKDSLSFLGQDFSSIIIKSVLKPFANLVKEEIAEDYEEIILVNKNLSQKEIKELKETIVEYKQQIESLQNELSQKTSSIGHSEAMPTTGVVAEEPAEYGRETHTSKEGCTSVAMQPDVDHIIELCLMTQKDLKKKAKELGCKITATDKAKELVKKIVKAEKNSSQKLFN